MRYRQVSSVVARTVAGEHVLVPLGGPAKRVFTLSRTGKALWDRLKTWAMPSELEAVLIESFGGSRDQVQADVGGFVAALQRFGLLEVDLGVEECPVNGRCDPGSKR